MPTEHDSQISTIGYFLARGNWNKETKRGIRPIAFDEATVIIDKLIIIFFLFHALFSPLLAF